MADLTVPCSWCKQQLFNSDGRKIWSNGRSAFCDARPLLDPYGEPRLHRDGTPFLHLHDPNFSGVQTDDLIAWLEAS